MTGVRPSLRARLSQERLNAAGFTLMEVMLAIALVAALVGAMLAFLVDVSASRARAQADAASRRAADVLLDRVEGDLMTCIAGLSSAETGFRGTSTSLEILTRGVAAPLALRDQHQRTLSDLQRAQYSFNSADHSLSAWKGPVDVAADPTSMGGRVARVRFRYLDDRRWLDSFDSAIEGHLPVAVEVAIWLDDAGSARANESAAAESSNGAESPHTGNEAVDELDSILSDESEAEPASPMHEPPPDRIRVITIPDAAASAGGQAGEVSS
jgi:prepilin-type N-terminal cleavage/methylation domain-containing protein